MSIIYGYFFLENMFDQHPDRLSMTLTIYGSDKCYQQTLTGLCSVPIEW